MVNRNKLFVVLSVVALLALAPAAMAQSSLEGYGGPNEAIAGLDEGGGAGGGGGGNGGAGDEAPAGPTARNGGGELPFTGADLGVLAAAAGLLLAFGVGLRRLTHRPSQT